MRTIAIGDDGIKLDMIYKEVQRGPMLPKNFYNSKDSISHRYSRQVESKTLPMSPIIVPSRAIKHQFNK